MPAWGLRALVALVKNLASVSTTLLIDRNHLQLQL